MESQVTWSGDLAEETQVSAGACDVQVCFKLNQSWIVDNHWLLEVVRFWATQTSARHQFQKGIILFDGRPDP